MGLLDRLRGALTRTREALDGGVRAVAGGGAPAWGALEEALLRADVGADVAARLVLSLRSRPRPAGGWGAESVGGALRDEVARLLGPPAALASEGDAPLVWLVSGVNGAGKTTTAAKLARWLVLRGRTAVLVAGDTFRAAGSEQLETWGERLGIPVFAGARGADPSSVCFDGVVHAKARSFGAAVVDTAGRLQTRRNLMDELKKIRRVVEKARGAPPAEVLLVLDGTSGQNALPQARAFHEALGVTGLVVTKLDGSARGGAVLAVACALGLPVKAVGVGEGAADLELFDPDAFSAALVSTGAPPAREASH